MSVKIYIQKQIYSNIVDFYIIQNDDYNRKRYLLQFGNPTQQLVELTEGSSANKPTFSLGGADSGEVLKALADAIAEIGVKTNEDKRREGKLEAVEAHLKDMQKLVFKED